MPSKMQMFFFCYHKVGSVLCAKISQKIAAPFGWHADFALGLVRTVDPSKQIVTFAHSLVGFDLTRIPHRGVRLVRDPRDVWLSGYLYHRHCREGWCINEAFDPTPPIMFPRVPLSQQHRSETWKRDYLAGLNGKSYQRNLLSLDQIEGLIFERDRYADWTISAMMDWQPDPHTIDVRLEDFMGDFEGTLTRILRHFGMRESDIPVALTAAATEDVRRMSDAQIDANPHIHSRSISKWRTMVGQEHIKLFEAQYGGAIEKLGYCVSSPGDLSA